MPLQGTCRFAGALLQFLPQPQVRDGGGHKLRRNGDEGGAHIDLVRMRGLFLGPDRLGQHVPGMGLFADAGGKPAVGVPAFADAARGSHEQVACCRVSRFIDRYAGCPKRLDPLVDAQVEGQLQRDCCVVNDLMDHFSAHIGGLAKGEASLSRPRK
ncbi:hypothetical protein EH244_09490 [Variovorax beijingensis]|uniref:Uncharacterized protein n=1 Tax=Variovorax beijingensis TaxID=2496117 RepID=A0A3P3EUU9_9BURK|nr:hypothetical protein [Variovorax beijingensis]RRH89806.1 hypothetical protein EH244_09490 [Variovorax beijingensis]RSZ41530.1 hypothetical protein EJO66_06310 [Variovorax beijingensis]